jgi:hypothetical protein
MIYSDCDSSRLKQGDIFSIVPRLDLQSISELSISSENDGSFKEKSLDDLAEELTGSTEQQSILAEISLVKGIVISQDCDASNGKDISFAEIVPFDDFFKISSLSKKVDAIKKLNHSTDKRRYFFLPPNEEMEIEKESLVDFRSVLRVKKKDVPHLMGYRQGRLNIEASQHFREKIAYFFRAYPVDEWYSFNSEQFAFYKIKNSDAKPRPGQE